MLTRTTSADAVNQMMSAAFAQPQDFTAAMANAKTVALVDDYGCALYLSHGFATYNLVFGVLPEQRGQWAADFLRASNSFMFTQTDAFLLRAHIAKDNEASFTLARYAPGGSLSEDAPQSWTWTWTIARWIREASSASEAATLMRAAGQAAKADEVVARMGAGP
jgi:hypothetical protein